MTPGRCNIIGCRGEAVTRDEQFGHALCEEHRSLTPVEASRCSNDPWERVRRLGRYEGSPESYVWSGRE